MLLKFSDGSFDIVVRIQNISDDDDLRRQAAEIAIEGQVGELAMMQHIQNLEVVSEFEGDLAGKGSSIKVLADHLAALVNT